MSDFTAEEIEDAVRAAMISITEQTLREGVAIHCWQLDAVAASDVALLAWVANGNHTLLEWPWTRMGRSSHEHGRSVFMFFGWSKRGQA